MKLPRAFAAAALLVPLAAPAMATSIALDPETGDPLANPPRIFLTLTDENGETAGDYILRDFSFRVAPSPEEYDSYLDERPRFTLTGIEQLDSALIAWATAEGGEGSARSATVQVLAADEDGLSLTYTIEDIVVHYLSAFHVSDDSERSSATLELSGSGLAVEERVLQTIEN